MRTQTRMSVAITFELRHHGRLSGEDSASLCGRDDFGGNINVRAGRISNSM